LIEHAAAAQTFFGATLRELDSVAKSFTRLSEQRCSDGKFQEILAALITEPKRPRSVEQNPGLKVAWEKQVATAKAARAKITELRMTGKGAELRGSRGTFWGVLNAVLEYVDHHHKVEQSRIAFALLGDGMDLKMKAFRKVQEEAAKAA
jgi:hypothetical protein